MAKGTTVIGLARNAVIATNLAFFILGIVMLGIAIAGQLKDADAKKQTDIMDSLNLGLLTIIIIVAAAATVFTAFLGFIGAWKKNMMLLKLYVVLTLITFITQIVIGAYLLNLDMSKLRNDWEQDNEEGYNRRVNLQGYLTCCGFDTWHDSIGTLHTACPYPPAYPSYAPPTTCFQASKNYVNEWLHPVAIAAIVIGCIESVAMVVSGVLVWKSKEKADDSAFSY